MPLFLEQRHSGTLFLAHPAMTRFSISLEASVALALRALSNSMGGELFVPKIPSYRLADLAEAVAPDIQLRQTGLRPGDKMHEAMITSSDAHRTLELDDLYVQLPSIPSKPLEDYQAFHGGRWAPEGFAYESDSNPDRLSVDDLRAEIRRHIDADFEPMVVQK
jgi:FlaA1/EpsC-like NDP-sugar epimerase